MYIINRIMKPSLVQRHIRIRLYKTLARPVLRYGSETWTLRKYDASRITASEMRFMRRTAGYTKDLSETAISEMPTLGLKDLEVLRLQDTESLKMFPSIYNFESVDEKLDNYCDWQIADVISV
ncbi:hypothetical protein ANN_17355 [Periplaneta americana]|uniref:Uncharacterized protein n=1 Tax=Periplaneta americana TaxID=6978 RepID=A0ABQ8SUU6_PERAM|nr:hypothetical protein ANN_17355 [Periplaneta americana]